MPSKDATRWQQNTDGSWSRRNPAGDEETTYVNPNATDGALQAAAEHGLDLADIQGTGKDGKITKADVEAAAKEETYAS